MDDVTDLVFRQIVINNSPADLYMTEFVNVDGLMSPGRNKLLTKLRFSQNEKSLIAQIWGKDPGNFFKVSKQIAGGTLAKELGLPIDHNYIGVDLNMGCPQKNEINSGTCAALMNNRSLAEEIISSTKKGIGNKLPLSVKTRLGYNEIDLSWIEFLLNQKLAMLTIHARTKKEKSKTTAHWEVFDKIINLRNRISPSTLIVGNGDVKNKTHGLALAKQYRLDGIMIGRGLFDDPFAFNIISPWSNYTVNQKLNLYKEHINLFSKTWKNNERPIQTLNKFCKVYISGFYGAKELREKLMKLRSTNELKNLINLELKNQAAVASSIIS